MRRSPSVAEDLIEVSRIALGEMRFVREHVDLSTLVSNCVASREASAREAGIELESALTPVVGVEGDPVRLSQVVMNLVGNAIQYTPSGGHVRVTLWQSGAQVVLAVTDTGRGVGAADVERMFRPFVRLGDGGAVWRGAGHCAAHRARARRKYPCGERRAGPRHHGDSRYPGHGDADELPRPPAMVPYCGTPPPSSPALRTS